MLVLAEKETPKGVRHNPCIVESFVNEFGRNSLQSLSQKLSQLSVSDGTCVLHRLSDNQKLLARLSCLPDDTKTSVAACLFNENRFLAWQYCDLPIDLLLNNYPSVEQAMVHYDKFLEIRPSIKLEREAFKLYCLHLASPERSLMINNMQSCVVDKADAPKAFKILGKLISVSSRHHHKDLRAIVWGLQTKPSLFVRLLIMGCFLTKAVPFLAGGLLCMKVVLFSQPLFLYISSFISPAATLPPFCLKENEIMRLATIIMHMSWGFTTSFCVLGMKDQFSHFKQCLARAYRNEPTLIELILNQSFSGGQLQSRYR